MNEFGQRKGRIRFRGRSLCMRLMSYIYIRIEHLLFYNLTFINVYDDYRSW